MYGKNKTFLMYYAVEIGNFKPNGMKLKSGAIYHAKRNYVMNSRC